MKKYFVVMAAIATFGCKPTNTEPTADEAPKAQTNGSTEQAEPTPAEPDGVEPNHYVFIAKPKDYRPLDCKIWDEPHAPRNRAPVRMNDATDFPQRYHMYMNLVEVIQNSPENPINLPPNDAEPKAMKVAFAVGWDASMGKDAKVGMEAYSKSWCERINTIMQSPFVVLHGYHIYVDHGNSGFRYHNDLGTDPGKQSAGFKTLEEAKAFAQKLVGAKK